jgi:hypothetical protein
MKRSAIHTIQSNSDRVRRLLADFAEQTEVNPRAGSKLGQIWVDCDNFSALARMNVDALLVHSVAVAKESFAAYHWYYDGLFLAASREAAGTGLYTMLAIETGVVLGNYEGALRTPDEYDSMNKAKHRYGLEVLTDNGIAWIIDPTDRRGRVLRGPKYRMAFINEPGPSRRANCKCVRGEQTINDLPTAEIVTTEAIAPFSEILWFYGSAYRRGYKVGKAARG